MTGPEVGFLVRVGTTKTNQKFRVGTSIILFTYYFQNLGSALADPADPAYCNAGTYVKND